MRTFKGLLPMAVAGLLSLVIVASAPGISSKQNHSLPTRFLTDAKVGTTKTELQAQITYSEHAVAFFTRGPHRWMPFPRHSTCGTLGVSARHVCRTARGALKAHRWLLDVAKHKYEKLYAPKPVVIPDDWAEFSCIHGYEGATNANTGNGYYGGLQMDLGFQRTYGPEFMARWGTANNWPVWAQVTAARRARDSGRGYGPWPNTARACGLL